MRELSQAANTGDIICELYEPSTSKEFRAEASPSSYVMKWREKQVKQQLMSKIFADTGFHSAADTESVNLHGMWILQFGSHVHSRGKRRWIA